MRNITCFYLTPIARAEVSLRRYASGSKCAGGKFSYHNASNLIGTLDVPMAGSTGGVIPTTKQKAELAWPKQCHCGYAFRDDDAWQINTNRLHTCSDGREDTTLQNAGVGAMWDAHWMSGMYRGPDGLCLILRTPAGDWTIDGKASNSEKGWTRTGTPPHVTARPSIGMGKKGHGAGHPYYHGFLTNGVLVACGDSDPY